MTESKETKQAKGDVEKKVAEEQEQGFLGNKVDPVDDAEYTLKTGPDSPPAVDDDRTGIVQQHVKKES